MLVAVVFDVEGVGHRHGHIALGDGQGGRVSCRVGGDGGFHQIGQTTRIGDAGEVRGVVAPGVAVLDLVEDGGLGFVRFKREGGLQCHAVVGLGGIFGGHGQWRRVDFQFALLH